MWNKIIVKCFFLCSRIKTICCCGFFSLFETLRTPVSSWFLPSLVYDCAFFCDFNVYGVFFFFETKMCPFKFSGIQTCVCFLGWNFQKSFHLFINCEKQWNFNNNSKRKHWHNYEMNWKWTFPLFACTKISSTQYLDINMQAILIAVIINFNSKFINQGQLRKPLHFVSFRIHSI